MLLILQMPCWLVLMSRRMKYTAFISILLLLSGCTSSEKALHITTIEARPKGIAKEKQRINTYNETTQRLVPTIQVLSKRGNSLQLSIRGNVSSSGLHSNKIRKIRLEKGKLEDGRITLKFVVDINKIAGKESASIRGYNYEQNISYKIPKGTRYAQLQLYENYAGNRITEHPTLVFEKTLKFTEGMYTK